MAVAEGGPLWQQVLDDLRRRLDEGRFDERFPTDRELMAQYGVSRHTVREAVRALQADGVVRRERGRGSYVVGNGIEQPLGTLYSLFESIEQSGMTQNSHVIAQGMVHNHQAAVILGLEPDTELFHLERVRLADDEPLAYDCVWIPGAIGAPLMGVDFGHTSLYEELRTRTGCVPQEGAERIRPLVPGSTEAGHLGIEVGEPVLEIDRRTRCDGRPLEWRITLVRGDRYTFRAEWSARGGEVNPRFVRQ